MLSSERRGVYIPDLRNLVVLEQIDWIAVRCIMLPHAILVELESWNSPQLRC